MEIPFVIFLCAALIPIVVGFLWYSPFLFADAWMKVSGQSEDKLKSGNMILILGLTYLFSFFIATTVWGFVVHQIGVFQLFSHDPNFMVNGSDSSVLYQSVMDKFGSEFRTFGHGALHGAILALTLTFPVIAINSLFERRGWKYIFIHGGYWLISLILMGGVIAQFA